MIVGPCSARSVLSRNPILYTISTFHRACTMLVYCIYYSICSNPSRYRLCCSPSELPQKLADTHNILQCCPLMGKCVLSLFSLIPDSKEKYSSPDLHKSCQKLQSQVARILSRTFHVATPGCICRICQYINRQIFFNLNF